MPSTAVLSPEVSDKDSNSLTAAADLIRALDAAYSDMNNATIAAARDAEEARRNARTAHEVARRFGSRSFPVDPVPGFEFSENHSVRPITSNGGFSSGGGGHRRPPKPPSTGERLTQQAHAEDVLSLSLELERARQSLESEQVSHDETKTALSQATAKNAQLEAQIEKLLGDMETQREDSGRRIDSLDFELNQARLRVEAAEEDAQLALDLAKQNDESRAQLEEYLQRALHEMQILREHIAARDAQDRQPIAEGTTTDPVMRVAEPAAVYPEEPAVGESPSSRPSRSLVAAGRQLLQRSLASPSEGESEFMIARSPQASAERRQRLKTRLQTLEEDDASSSLLSFSARSQVNDLGAAVEALDVCRNAADVLKESGTRLGLSGRWNGSSNTTTDELHLETLARHYCTSIEILLDRRQKEIVELESLCSLMEGVNPTSA